MLFMGDLNIDLLGFPRSSLAVDLISILLSHSFLPLVNKPTRATSTSLSLIDYIISNDLNHINQSVTDIFTTSISDHFFIRHSVQLSHHCDTSNHISHISYLVNQSTLVGFYSTLENRDWNELLSKIDSATDINDSLNSFYVVLTEAFQTCFPKTQRTHNNLVKPWITDIHKNSIKEEYRLHRVSKRHPNDEILRNIKP